MNHLRVLGLLTVALAGVPAASYAQSAYAAQDMALLAGPSTEYPEVAILPRGTAVYVQGCLSDYRWCDVVAGPHRGWAYAGNIVYPYRGANVSLAAYGAAIGIGVLAFSVAPYWDSYYVGRPWYPQRQLWINRPAPAHYGPGGHPPQRGHRPPGGHPPQQGHRPPDGHAPPPKARPAGGHPQQRHRDGGGQHPQKEHNQGSR